VGKHSMKFVCITVRDVLYLNIPPLTRATPHLSKMSSMPSGREDSKCMSEDSPNVLRRAAIVHV
jgi:hypothetical protein